MPVLYGYSAVTRQAGGPVDDIEQTGVLGSGTSLLWLGDDRIALGYSGYNLGDNGSRFALTDPSFGVLGSVLLDGVGSQVAGDIAMLSDGRIAFAYHDVAADQNSSHVIVDVFTTTANGIGIGVGSSLSLLLPMPSTFNDDVDIAATLDGGFIAAWDSQTGFGEPTNLNIGRFGVDAVTGQSTLVSQFQLSAAATGGGVGDSLFLPSLISLTGGGYELAFLRQTGSGTVLEGLRLGADGSLDGSVVTIDSGVELGFPVSASLPDGGWVAAYQRGGHVFARIYDADGAPTAAPWQVDTQPLQSNWPGSGPSVDVFENGNFEIVWAGGSPFGSTTNAIWGRLYAPTGQALSHPDLLGLGSVASSPVGTFALPVGAAAVAALDGSGEFAAAWFRTVGRSLLQDLNAVRFGFERTIISDDAGDIIDASAALGPDAFAGNIGAVVAIEGHGGDDQIFGTDQGETITGGAGNDYVEAGGGGDLVHGDGDAVIAGKFTGFDEMATDGSDVIFAGAGQDTVIGGGGDDVLVGNADTFAQEMDILYGDGGNDTFYAEFTDFIIGGAGHDVVYQVNDNAWVLDLGLASIEYMRAGFGDDVLDGATQVENLEIYSGGGNDVVTGGSGNDVLWGEAGDDILVGGDGNDVLFGALGQDRLSGGNGDDLIFVDSTDTFADGGAGFDVLYITSGPGMTFDLLATGFEFVADLAGGNDELNGAGLAVDLTVYAGGGTDLISGGTGGDFLWGEGGGDTIVGNNGDDVLVGGTGIDVMTGGAGTDVVYMNSGGGSDGLQDRVVMTADWGTDFVFDFVHGEDKIDMTVLGTNFGALNIANSFGHAYITIGAGTNLIAVANNGGLLTAEDFLF